jgi:formylglycine-generating enzyme required for sulfatase activity
VFPQGYISRVEAAAACGLASKRLCSLGEFDRACRGKRHALYPYGPRGKNGVCNSGKKHLLTELFGANGRAWKYDENFNSPELLKTPGYLAKTGEYEGCKSEDEVMDLVGNLHEWVSTSVDQALVDRMDEEPVERRKQPWREGNGIFASGFFSTTKEHGPGCAFLTIAHEPTYHDYSIGFRCCRAAEVDEPSKPPPKK